MVGAARPGWSCGDRQIFLRLVRRDLGEDLCALVHRAPQRTSARVTRPLAGIALAVCAFALYLALAIRLDASTYFTVDNLAFDFDPLRNIIELFKAGAPSDFRHPLLWVLRPLMQGLLHLGLPLNLTVSLVFAAVGAATVFVIFTCTGALGVMPLEGVLLTAFFAISSTPLFVALVPESYGLSALGLSVLYLMVMQRRDDPSRWRRTRFAVAVYLFGVTFTNVVQAAIAETVIWFRQLPLLAAIARLSSYAVILGVLIVLAIVASVNWPYFLHDPVVALKQLYWAGSLHGEEKVSFATLLRTFFVYSFVAPDFTSVPLPNGEATMLDFRDFRMTIIGLAAMLLWLALLAIGFLAGLRDRTNRTLFLSAAGAVLLNLLMHISVQYRGSVYIYAAHLHVPIFMMALFAGRIGSQHGGASAGRSLQA